jgi:hypothetical protein
MAEQEAQFDRTISTTIKLQSLKKFLNDEF